MVMAPQSPQLVGSPAVPQAPVSSQSQRVNPFRRATVERIEQILQVSKVQTTSDQANINKLIGTGFVKALHHKVATVTASNAATVAYAEDAPWNTISLLVLHDVNGDLINLTSGFSAYVLGLYGGDLSWPFALPQTTTTAVSVDTNFWSLTAGSGGTGGSSTFFLTLPVAVDDRDLIGLVGNQNQSQAYDLRAHYAASGSVYGTAPTTLGTVTQTTYYEERTVPNQYNPDGSQNQSVPNTYGILHYWLEAQDQASPAQSSTITHRLQRLGQTLRSVNVVLRSNALRATAESNLPTSTQVKIGEQPLFVEDPSVRRLLMFRRTGHDAPKGILSYDWIHDFDGQIGQEYGNDWIYSQDITVFTLLYTYPSGWTNASSSLTYLTDDLAIPAGINPYNP